MTNHLNNRILIMMGKLALAKSITLDAQIGLQDLLDEHSLERVAYDEKTLRTVRGAMYNLDHSESMINSVMYDISVEFFKELTDQTDPSKTDQI